MHACSFVCQFHAEPTNHYLGVQFDLLRSNVHCTFLGQQQSDEKFCAISYNPGEMCTDDFVHKSNISGNASHFLTVKLPVVPRSQSNIFCYTITAGNGTFTSKVEGRFNAGVLYVYVYACMTNPQINS